MSLALEIGRLHRIETSANLVTGTALFSFTSPAAAFQFLDAQATNHARCFYRVVSP